MSSLILPGTIVSYVGHLNNLPANWLFCNGLSVSTNQYPALYSAIGAAFGSVGENYFNLPDLQGMFLRGMDNGAGVDPDTATRQAPAPNGNTGDMVGSVQLSAFASHAHQLGDQNGYQSTGDYGVYLADLGGGSTGVTGGSETRPINVYVNYLIYSGDLS